MPPSAPQSSHLSRLAILVGLLLLFFTLAFGASTWESVRADHIRQMRTVLDLSEKAIDRYLLQAEIGLRELAGDITASDGLNDLAVANRYLTRYAALHPESSSVSLLRLDGQMIATSLKANPAELPSMASDPTFQAFVADHFAATSMVLGRPRIGNISKRWVFPMRYTVRDANGAPVAVLAASLPVAMLEGFWRDAPVVQRASIGLLGDDGYLLSRFPVPEGVDMATVYGQPRKGALYTHLVDANHPHDGYVEGYNHLFGQQVANAFLRLEHYPATVFVSMPMSDFLIGWWERVRVPLGLILSSALLGGIGFVTMARQHGRLEGERRASDAALRASETEQRFLVDHMVAGVAMLAPDGSVQSTNPRARRILDLPEPVAGAPPLRPDTWEMLREDGSPLPAAQNPVRRVIADQMPIRDLTVGIVKAPGATPIWLLCSLEPEPALDPAHQGIRRVVITFIDITARRDAERASARSERRFRLLFENSLDGVMQTRPDGRIVKVNPAGCALFSADEATIVQGTRSRFTDPDDPRLKRLVAEREAFGRASGEISMFRSDGSRFEAEVSTAAYVDDDGERYCSVVVRDVTDRKLTQAAVAARDAAENANRAKSRFVAHMSHELRTPLNAILGFSHVLTRNRQQPLATAQRTQVQHIHQAGEHLLSMIDDLLDLSRMESGATRLTQTDVDPLALVRQAVRELQVRAAQRVVGVSIVDTRATPSWIRADATRFKQVVLNLVSNAIKYNRVQGSVTVRLALEGDALAVEVADTGIGLSVAQRQSLFQPFNRLGREETGIEGTGIGLVITRTLVELMGGAITVDSREALGSTFRFTHPHLIAPPLRKAADPAVRPAGVRAADEPLRPCRVLYIDDNPINCLVIEALLESRRDVELTIAGGGLEGLALARAALPDLMLVDMRMPDLDGFGVVQAVRATPALAQVRCVAVSASAMPEEIAEALGAGFDAYFTKPLPPDVLLPEIERVLHARVPLTPVV